MNSSLLLQVIKQNYCQGFTSIQLMLQPKHRLLFITQFSIVSTCPTIEWIIAPKLKSSIQFIPLEYIKLSPKLFQYQSFTCPLCCQQTIFQIFESLKNTKI